MSELIIASGPRRNEANHFAANASDRWRDLRVARGTPEEAQRMREAAGELARELNTTFQNAMRILSLPDEKREAEISKLQVCAKRGVQEAPESVLARELGIPIAAAARIMVAENRVGELLRTIGTLGQRISLLEDEVKLLGGEINVLKNPRK